MRPWNAILLLTAAMLAAAPIAAETLLVVRKTDDAVDFMDPGSGLRLASVPTGNAPHEVSVSPDGKRAAVSNYGTREQPGSTLSIVDLEQPHEIQRIDLAPHTRPHGVAWFAADRIAVTTEGSQHLLVVDPDSGKIVATIETAQETSHMVVVSADERRAYVTNIGSGTVTAIDLVAGRKLLDMPPAARLRGACPHPGRPRTLGGCTRRRAHRSRRYGRAHSEGAPAAARHPDPDRNDTRRPHGPGHLRGVERVRGFRCRKHARSEAGARWMSRLRPVPPNVRFARLAPGSVLPVGLLVSRDGRSAYVAATMGDRVVQFDTRTLEVLRSIDVGGEPDGLASTPVIPRAVCHGCTPLESHGSCSSNRSRSCCGAASSTFKYIYD